MGSENKLPFLVFLKKPVLFFVIFLTFVALPEPAEARWVFQTVPNTPRDDVYPYKWGLNGYSLVQHNGMSYLYIYGEHYRTDSNSYPTTFILYRYKWNNSKQAFEYYDVLTDTIYNGNRRRFFAFSRLKDWETGVYMFRHHAVIDGQSHWANVNRKVTFSDWITIGEGQTSRVALLYFDSEHKESKIRIRNAEARSMVQSISVNTTDGIVMDVRGAMVSTDNGYDVRTFGEGVLREFSDGVYHVKGDHDVNKTGSTIYLKDPNGKEIYSTYSGTEYSLGINAKPFRYGKRNMKIPVSVLKSMTKLGSYPVDYEINVLSGDYGTRSYARGRLSAPSGYSQTITLQSNDGAYRNYRVYAATQNQLTIEVTDATPPTATTSQSPTDWTRGEVTLRVYNISDKGGSGYHRTLLPNGQYTTSTDITYKVSRNGTYTFVIYDRHGNKTEKTFNVTNIDNTAPSVTFNPNGGLTYKQSHSTIVTVSDSGSGVKSRQYAWSTSSSQQPTSWTSFSNGATLNTPSSTGDHYLWVRSEDNVGNVSVTKSNVFRVDRTAPEHVSSSITGERYRDGSTYWVRPGDVLTVTFRQRDQHSGNDRGYIRLTGSGQDVRYSHGFNNSSKTAMTVVDSQFANTSSVQVLGVERTEHDTTNGYGTLEWRVKLNTSGHTYSIQYYYRDNASNSRGYTTVATASVDGEPPTLNVTKSTTAPTNGNVTLTATASDSLSGVKRIRKPDGTWVSGSSATYTATSNGTYSFIAEDHVGNQRTVNVTVSNIDKESPEFDISYSPTEWTNKDVSIRLTNIRDSGGSGYSHTRLPNGETTTDSNITYTVSSNGDYTFTVYDKANNATSKVVKIRNIDKVKPNGKITKSTESLATEVVLKVEAYDDASGVKSITLPNGVVVHDTVAEYRVSRNGEYSFVVTDVAGNENVLKTTVTNIDSEPPELVLTITPDGWTKGPVTIIVTARDNLTVERITLPDGRIVYDVETRYTVSQNGSYTFKACDTVGNCTEKTVTVSNIDNKRPDVRINEVNREKDRIHIRLEYSDGK